MIAHVVAAGNPGQPRGGVALCGRGQNLTPGIMAGQGGCDAPHAPRAAQVEAIQVHELAVAAVGPLPFPRPRGGELVGFLAGINLCPPFLPPETAIGMYAPQSESREG